MTSTSDDPDPGGISHPPVGTERATWTVVGGKATRQAQRWDGTNWEPVGPPPVAEPHERAGHGGGAT